MNLNQYSRNQVAFLTTAFLSLGGPSAFLNARAYVHTLGTNPDQDPVLLGSGASPSPFLAPTTYPFVGTARGCPWLFGVVLNGVQKEWTIYLAPARSLESGNPAWRKVVAEEVMVKAPDGVFVPMSIVHMKGLKRDGNHPLILDGYGSYGISQTPTFGPSSLAWYERGGIIAVAHVRGGGEYGTD